MTNIDDYADYAMSSWSSSKPVSKPEDLTDKDLYVMSLGFPGEVGEACEKLKKRVRDEGIPGCEFDKKAFMKEMGDAIYYWAMLLNYFGVKPSDVLAMNIEKSTDRRIRGVEHGSGDDR
jgi:NTP pyrophosphatase (non-canonical NTP hydrolase)